MLFFVAYTFFAKWLALQFDIVARQQLKQKTTAKNIGKTRAGKLLNTETEVI